MLTYQKIAKHPSAFRSFTGLSRSEFDQLFSRFLPEWQAAERERLSQTKRKRRIGAGRKYNLALRSQLLMTLIWLHLYLNTATMGVLLDIHKSTVSRNTRRVLAVLRQLGEQEVWWKEPPANGRGKTLKEAIEECPDLLLVIDVFEQRRYRPTSASDQHQFYSPKTKGFTNKIGLIVNEVGQIRGVTSPRPGRCHDLTLMRESGLLPDLPHDTPIIGDKAFDGIQHTLPDHSVATPHKARRKRPLTQSQRWANRHFSQQRMIVENTICELRRFKVLHHQFRHRFTLVDDVVKAVIALINPRIAQRVAAR